MPEISQPPALSLGDVHGSVRIAEGGPRWRRWLAYVGPGYIIAVGYMDPGNWATDIAAGSAYGYRLLAIVLLASLMAMVLQALSAWLGIGAGRGPGAADPRRGFAGRGVHPLALRAKLDHRLRRGGGDRRRDRAQPVVRATDDGGRHPHGGGRLDGAAAAAPWRAPAGSGG